MLSDDVVFNEIEQIIDNKKKRYKKALEKENNGNDILSRVTQLEDSLIDAYLKYIKMKYYVKERRFAGNEKMEEEIEEFIEIVGDE